MTNPVVDAVALKPCPFCGGEAYLEHSYTGGPYALCDECGAATMYGFNEAEAIAAWNTRQSADAALVEALEDIAHGEDLSREDCRQIALRCPQVTKRGRYCA